MKPPWQDSNLQTKEPDTTASYPYTTRAYFTFVWAVQIDA